MKFISQRLKPVIFLRIAMGVTIRYTAELLSGKLTPKRYLIMLWRLANLLGHFYQNRIVKINDTYKIHLYLPAYPSPAFFHAIKKFDPAIKDAAAMTVVFSMTKACGYKCPHCYQRQDEGTDLPIELLKKTANEMLNMGVAMFDIEGGEPLIRFDRLIELLSAFDSRAELWVNTTGHTLTEEKARKMREAKVFGVMISLHSPDAAIYDGFTGINGSFETAKKAVKIFNDAGIMTAINYCPSTDDIESGAVDRLFSLGKELGCAFIQVIHQKNSGAWLNRKENGINSNSTIKKLTDYHLLYNNDDRYLGFPSISSQVFEESREHFGCTAGGVERFYLNHEGEVQPCEFINVSFGNVAKEPFPLIFKRMREHFKKPGTNWLCCSEAASIANTIRAKGLTKTPIPRDETMALVKSWNKGEETPLFKKLKLYE